MRGVDIDEAIDGFVRAVENVGLPDVLPPADLTSLEELEAAIAPLRIPPAVRRFWERVDTRTLRARTGPNLHGPDLALSGWLSGQEYGLEPPALLPIAWEATCMGVELEQPGIQGGALFEWDIDGPFERRFDDLQGWLLYLTWLLDTGRFAEREATDGPFAYVPDPDDWEVEPGWRPQLEPHPVHGVITEIGRDILEWPAHWQLSAGLTPDLIEPRGATHTIAALMGTDPSQPAEATLRARVVSLTSVGAATTVRVDDGTGLLVIHCPAGTNLLGPVLGDWFEFDVRVPAGPRQVAGEPSTVALDEPDPEERLEARFIAQYGQPAGAVATAVRRAPDPRHDAKE